MRKSIFVLMFMLLSMLLCGCSESNAVKASTQLHEITDTVGNVIKVPIKPQRIVSLNLGTDEILIDLVKPERIVALSYLAEDEGISSIVDKAKKVNKKLTDKGNVEAIIALNPDIVFMSDAVSADVGNTLREMGINLYISKTPATIEETKTRVLDVAKVVDEVEKGQALVADMESALAEVNEKLASISDDKKRTIIAFSFSGAFGRKTALFNDMCVQAKVVNGAGEAGLEKGEILSKEQIVKINPDIFLLPTWNTKRQSADSYREEIRSDPAYQNVKAIKNNQLIYVSDRYRYCVSQYVTDSMQQIAKAVYPEYF
jgi:iron complex transport system substrate-binding protein